MAYYYLISGLPMLKADGDMPISYSEFLAMCKDNVSASKYEILKDLSVTSGSGPLFCKWAEFYNDFKEELTYQRNIRLGQKTRVPNQKDESVSKIIAQAMNNKNPLEAENMLLALEFQKLDEFIGTHYFDDYALMGYALKLKLLERKTSFKKESGKQEFNRIIDNLEKQIMNMEQE